MPLEVTPIPFPDQLPYNPKFIPSDTQGPGAGGSTVPRGAGPASAAASAILPPEPGGIASPHRAIPAIPDAGYTAPGFAPSSLHSRSIVGGPRPIQGPYAAHGGYPGPGPGGSVYGGASVYGGIAPSSVYTAHGIRQPPPGDQFAASSLPAPRRPALQPETVNGPHAHHQHQHQHHPHHHRHLPREAEYDDGGSDASYYARPRASRRRSRSISSYSYSDSDMSSPREDYHKQLSSNHHSPSHSPNLASHARTHSPMSPSPLSRAPSQIKNDSLKSPASPASRARGHELGPRERYTPSNHGSRPTTPPLDDQRRKLDKGKQPEGRISRHTSLRGDDGYDRPSSANGGQGERSKHKYRDRQNSSQSSSDSEGSVSGDEDSEPLVERHRQHQHHHRHRAGTVRAVTSDGEYAARSDYGRHHHNHRHHHHHPHASAPVSGNESAGPSDLDRHHHHHRRQYHRSIPNSGDEAGVPPIDRGLHHHHNHPSRQAQYLAFPQTDETTPAPRVKAPPQHHNLAPPAPPRHHRHHSSSQIPPPDPSLLAPPPIDPRPQRRRAVSMEYERPPPQGYYPPPPTEVYDDGASIAGSAMTFMDGPVQGRTSQYGLPKYAHQPKPDYRRFMVQRGNADVFLD